MLQILMFSGQQNFSEINKIRFILESLQPSKRRVCFSVQLTLNLLISDEKLGIHCYSFALLSQLDTNSDSRYRQYNCLTKFCQHQIRQYLQLNWH